MSTKEALLAQVNDVLQGSGYVATHIGPSTVGVQGDARAYGPSVIVDIGFNDAPPNWEHVGKYATEIVNQVRGVTRVLVDITSR